MSDQEPVPPTYKASGVDIAAGEAFVERLKPLAEQTRRPEVLGGLGGFGGLFELNRSQYRHPILVAAVDGVGTKLKLANILAHHKGVGVDLVAMCVNDLLVSGAEPLFFLDYFATGRLEPELATQVMEGITTGCHQAGCALLGGETAEMPGMYQGSEYDLAGFAVGVVERSNIIDGRHAAPGDILLGFPSTGVHSNGFSLIRRILQTQQIDLTTPLEDKTLGELLLEPTRIYTQAFRSLMAVTVVNAAAHITGGGLLRNIERILPTGVGARLHRSAWPRPPIFDWLIEQGGISEEEMLNTFNCGLGMVAVIPEAQLDIGLAGLEEAGETVYCVGQLESEPAGRVVING